MAWNIFKKKSAELNSSPQTNENSSNSTEHNSVAGEAFKVSLSYLTKLIPIGKLPDSVLQKLKVRLLQFKPGKTVFQQGMETDSIFYLVKGKIYLEAVNGSGRQIDANTMAAFYPLSNGKIHQFTAIAESDAKVISIPRNEILEEKEENKIVSSELEIPEQLKNNTMFQSFYDSLKKGNLQLPNLPDAGLIHNIGVIPVLKFADSQSKGVYP